MTTDRQSDGLDFSASAGENLENPLGSFSEVIEQDQPKDKNAAFD
jgi:hypothetical protein